MTVPEAPRPVTAPRDLLRATADADESNTAPCPVCGEPMHAVRGSKSAICANCGFKDSVLLLVVAHQS